MKKFLVITSLLLFPFASLAHADSSTQHSVNGPATPNGGGPGGVGGGCALC